ncbi:hypothetical protein BC834DRAFT_967264 [Gloeopeniophorella convolvens]|nr:hypothetical protein BC834DRAFT_967264 [Gloeopeniophorella convolvens]
MVHWHDPGTILNQLETFVKVVHFTTGVYIWEFVSTLNFEWSILRGRRKWRWTVALYIACRLTTLAAAVTELTGFNLTNRISCKTWLVFARIFAYTSTTLALALYALRSIAVWHRNSYLILFLIASLITNVGLWMRLAVNPGTEWNAETRTCLITEAERGLPNSAAMFATDVVLFGIILSGVYQRNSGRRILATMYREGLFWLAIATVFISLNLNDVMNLMFQTPAIICSGIGATRMYRKIFDRHAGNLLEYLESSRDEATGEIRFRRQTQLVSRHDATGLSSALPLERLVRAPPSERYVERFEACEIRLERAGSGRGEEDGEAGKIDPDLVL